MPEQRQLRVGFVGAGANTRLRHIPGFKAIPGVTLAGVANRTRKSGQAVAKEFGITRVFDTWVDLVDSSAVDAVCIGTWPSLHFAVTMRALEQGKHVLTEARMAMNGSEAHAMLDASREHPDLVAQVVPAPYTFAVDETIQDMVAQGFLGRILAVDVRYNQDSFIDTASPLHWRQDADLSGFNVLALGIVYESLMRWVGPATRVLASTRVFANSRRDADGRVHAVTVPDHVDVLCDLAVGAQAHLQFSAVTALAPKPEAWLFGSEGTLHVDIATNALRGARRGDKSLQPIVVPPEKVGTWRVEQEFVDAILGKAPVKLTTFEDGVRYMEFTEAVARSAQSGSAVHLPL